ncbi:MAG: secretion protein HlyD, partial [Pseudomonadota bacterium]
MKRTLSALAALTLFACADETSRDSFIGYIEAEYVYVATPEAGWLVDAAVREGDEVSVGQRLFSLE